MAEDVRTIIDAAARQYGVDPQTLLRIGGIESQFDPNAQNPRSSAGGLFQFVDGTARQYGLADRFDPAQAADAAARLTRDNATILQRQLGRAPTPAELYLAHQQGAGGAAALLSNPNRLAADIVGARAVALNGGRIGMTAQQFADLWAQKFGGATGAAPNQPPAPAPSIPAAMAPPVAAPPPSFGDLLMGSSGGGGGALPASAPDNDALRALLGDSSAGGGSARNGQRGVKPPQPTYARPKFKATAGPQQDLGKLFG